MKKLENNSNYNEFCEYVVFIVSRVLGDEVRNVHLNSSISEFSLDSMTITKIISVINKVFQLELSPVTLYGHKTLKDIASHLYKRYGKVIKFRNLTLELVQITCDKKLIEPLDKKNTIPKNNYCKQIKEATFKNKTNSEYLFVFSASNKDLLLECLKNIAYDLGKYVNEPDLIVNLEFDLMNICKSEKERLVIIAKDNVELLTEINNYISGKFNDQIYSGKAIDGNNKITMFTSCKEARLFLKSSFYSGNVKKIAALWSLGIEIDWSIFFKKNQIYNNPFSYKIIQVIKETKNIYQGGTTESDMV